ncbi:MAG TPA: translational GTPase TypA [Patescibacteria group bacterium]|nr:translational GTPase TypA [Patescibacteria group bacterium]
MKRTDIRNVAIIAHVDHGKTTLVDALLKQTQTVKDDGGDLVMDSMDLERERGITIRAKNASLQYKGVKINIVDTPGHADFGGEVERTLKMADGVLLLVDAKEGPMPQTKFVLKKALELGHKAVVVINKVDKPDAQVDHTINKTFDLFVTLGATDEQTDFPIIYASGKNGVADLDVEKLLSALKAGGYFPNEQTNITPVLDTILEHIPAPDVEVESPFALLVMALAYDNFKGRMGVGKILSGKISKGQNLLQINTKGEKKASKVSSLQQYSGMKPVDVEGAEAGDIVAIAGFDDIHIGDTLTDPANPVQLEPVHVEPPTVRMSFGVNTSPFAGREGKLVTSRQIRDRLTKELETNVALQVDFTEGGDKFLVSGRGELHLGILIETMRREGFELEVSQPEVIFHEENGQKLEPYEHLTVDIPNEYQGTMIQEVSKRGGELLHMETNQANDIHAEYLIPTRGVIGLKNLMLTRTRGTAVINNLFDSYRPVHEIDTHANDHGSLIASESGTSSSYGLNNAQERGVLFIGSAVEVYEGMVVGQNALNDDLEVNVCKGKKLTNMRSSGADDAIILTPPKDVELDFALEYVGPDELVEFTPKSIRIRKKILNQTERKRSKR